MSSTDRRQRISLNSLRSNSARLFEKTNESGKLGNFLSLSEHARSIASRGLQRKATHQSKISQKGTRRQSIFNSLDKFLDNDGERDDTTEATSYQSSFSSGFSNDTLPQHTSLANGGLARREPQIAADGNEANTRGNTGNETSQRYRRR